METRIIGRKKGKAFLNFLITLLVLGFIIYRFLMMGYYSAFAWQTQVFFWFIIVFLTLRLGFYIWQLGTKKPYIIMTQDDFTMYAGPFRTVSFGWKDIDYIRHQQAIGYKRRVEIIEVKYFSDHPIAQARNARSAFVKAFDDLEGEIQVSLHYAKGISYRDCLDLMNTYRRAAQGG